MIAHLKELEILGAVIDGKTQVDIMLIMLLESFKFFRLSYSESRGYCSLTKFLKMDYKQRRASLAINRTYRWGKSFSSSTKENNKKKRLLN